MIYTDGRGTVANVREDARESGIMARKPVKVRTHTRLAEDLIVAAARSGTVSVACMTEMLLGT
ncbi:MAG: hypothetical protein OJJ55_06620 [Rhodococcus sp.]|nr:hypothetical protein [Rhodococcus sp. (in: high G+C Gram-positive bacteria)]